jgi:hypothetical protein
MLEEQSLGLKHVVVDGNDGAPDLARLGFGQELCRAPGDKLGIVEAVNDSRHAYVLSLT